MMSKSKAPTNRPRQRTGAKPVLPTRAPQLGMPPPPRVPAVPGSLRLSVADRSRLPSLPPRPGGHDDVYNSDDDTNPPTLPEWRGTPK
jgi:hypothetical protein